MTEQTININVDRRPVNIVENISLERKPYLEKCSLCKKDLENERIELEHYVLGQNKKEIKERFIFCCEFCFIKWCEKYVKEMNKGV